MLFRAVAALALVGLAAPAFPCGDQKQHTASTAEAKGKEQVAKADKKAAAAKTAQAAQQQKAAKATY
jgi:hypothetical protein